MRFFIFLMTIFLLGVFAACSDDNPLTPAGDNVVPVEFAAQIEGRWRSVSVVAAGLPVTNLLIPAFGSDVNNSRLSFYETDLVVSVTGEKSGLFSLAADGIAADTANPMQTTFGTHDVWGGFSLGEEGALSVELRMENSTVLDTAKYFAGGARLAGDTLLLDFYFSAPPQKAVSFLPSTATFIARLIPRD